MTFVKESKLQLESTPLVEFFNSIVTDMGISDKITIHMPTNDVTIQSDKIKLHSLFSNLILNAIQAMDNKGIITIRISKKLNNLVEIEIEDDGPSIPEENIKKIFEPLFTTKQVGTGLGLASCKKIVEQHHGTILSQMIR
ncbi:MAG: GHKL domain-containing protein [Nitrosopumilus sp.]|nr:GHKL domain-containing protein [Nitrosopumilus sp.]